MFFLIIFAHLHDSLYFSFIEHWRVLCFSFRYMPWFTIDTDAVSKCSKENWLLPNYCFRGDCPCSLLPSTFYSLLPSTQWFCSMILLLFLAPYYNFYICSLILIALCVHCSFHYFRPTELLSSSLMCWSQISSQSLLMMCGCDSNSDHASWNEVFHYCILLRHQTLMMAQCSSM